MFSSQIIPVLFSRLYLLCTAVTEMLNLSASSVKLVLDSIKSACKILESTSSIGFLFSPSFIMKVLTY